MTDPAFLSVTGLSVAFRAIKAVNDVGFAVRRGEHVTLLGPSGCGKTTTLRAIAGLEKPTAGRIAIDGIPVHDKAAGIDLPPERRSLSMVFQSYAIWPHMTVFENVAFSFRVRGLPHETARAAVDRALALVDLADYANRPATRLSGGQQQRVALARAIAFDSKIILFDEPLSNLDAQLRIAMRTELAALQQRLGFTAVYVTHDQEEAFALSDHIVVMRGGRIEQEGTPDAIHRAPRNRFVAAFLGVRNIIDAEVQAPRAEARLGDGTILRSAQPVVPGADAVCFRPIDVQLSAVAGPGQGGEGVLVQRLFMGDLVHYGVQCGPYQIWACDRPRDDLSVGTTVHWRIEPQRCLLLGP